MKCHESKTIIYLYLDGEASEKQQAGLFSHLKECPACRQEMVRAQSLHELLAKNCILVEEIPKGFRDGIMAKIDIAKQTPIEETILSSVIRRRKFWETKLGIGLLAGAAGLFLTYYIASDIPNTNIAAKNPPPKIGITQGNTQPKVNMQLAEAEKINKEIAKPEQKDPKNSEPDSDVPKKTTVTPPVKAAKGVAESIVNLGTEQGTVDLPKPLSISKYIYNENIANNIAPTGDNLQQPLNSDLPPLKGRAVSAQISNRSLQIITQSANIAKLWKLEPTAIKAQEITSKEITGLVVNSGNKLLDLEAEKAAVSPAGVIASITNVNNVLQLSIGGESTPLDGTVISELTWTPDGKKVLYFISDGKLGHLESYDGENPPVQLTPAMPAQQIAWTFVDDNKLILNIQTDISGLWELQLSDGKLKPLAGVGGGKCVASNSKNDIAFTDSKGKIYVLMHDDGGAKKLVELTTQEKSIPFLTWVNDKTLLYLVSGQEQTELWKIVLP